MKLRDHIQLCVFDVILCDNDLMYDKSLYQRKQALHSMFPNRPEIGIQILDEIEARPDTNLLSLIQQSVAGGCEGLVVKKLESRYSFGVRNRRFEGR